MKSTKSNSRVPAPAKSTKRAPRRRRLSILRNDPWLEPYAEAIEGRHAEALRREKELVKGCRNLDRFANAHNYFGLHRTDTGWVFREWAPNATSICLIGDFNGWKPSPEYELANIGGGVWEVALPAEALSHGQLYKMLVKWPGGEGERIPAYATRVVQDSKTAIFLSLIHI